VSELNRIPTFTTDLERGGVIAKDWYFFWTGLFRRLPPSREAAVTPGASPYIYSAPVGGALIVQGGTVTLIEFSRDGVTWFDVGVVAGMLPVNAADQLRITYAVAPTLTFVPQ
jgi:hypothetical protein